MSIFLPIPRKATNHFGNLDKKYDLSDFYCPITCQHEVLISNHIGITGLLAGMKTYTRAYGPAVKTNLVLFIHNLLLSFCLVAVKCIVQIHLIA